jgi:hypothetical protein
MPKASETCSFDLHGSLYFSQNPQISLFSKNPQCTNLTRHALLAKKNTHDILVYKYDMIVYKYDMLLYKSQTRHAVFNPKPNHELTIGSILPFASQYLSIHPTGYKRNP